MREIKRSDGAGRAVCDSPDLSKRACQHADRRFVCLPALLAAFGVPALVYGAGMRVLGVKLGMPVRTAGEGKARMLEQPNI